MLLISTVPLQACALDPTTKRSPQEWPTTKAWELVAPDASREERAACREARGADPSASSLALPLPEDPAAVLFSAADFFSVELVVAALDRVIGDGLQRDQAIDATGCSEGGWGGEAAIYAPSHRKKWRGVLI